MLKILNAEPLDYSEKAARILREIGDVTSVQLGRNELLSRIRDFNVLIVRLAFQINQEIIDAAPNLQAIVTATTGVDHIDMEYAAKRGIQVLSLRGEVDFLHSIPATAEHTWALISSLTRNIPRAAAASLMGQWDRDSLRGHDLAGRRLGIVGLGRIGEKVARYGLAFDMKVSAFDPYRRGWITGVDRYFTLNDLLSVSDILSLHVPLNDLTYHLLGYRELCLLPNHALLINTARGGVLDGGALLTCLEEGLLGGAALDVLEGELNRAQLAINPLLSYAREHSNLIITPHIGGATYESMAATEIFMANKLKRWAEQNRKTDTNVDTYPATEMP